jgi:hypothetical protein
MLRSQRLKNQGIALITALTIAAVLFVLASAFLIHLREDFHAHRQRQWGVQAEWNARSSLETYRYTRTLPVRDPETSQRIFHCNDSKSEICVVTQTDRGLRFEGVSHGVHRSLLLLGDGTGRVLRVHP